VHPVIIKLFGIFLSITNTLLGVKNHLFDVLKIHKRHLQAPQQEGLTKEKKTTKTLPINKSQQILLMCSICDEIKSEAFKSLIKLSIDFRRVVEGKKGVGS